MKPTHCIFYFDQSVNPDFCMFSQMNCHECIGKGMCVKKRTKPEED